MKKVGIIGSGNMGSAILSGIIKAKLYEKEELMVSDKDKVALDKISQAFDVQVTIDNNELVENCAIVVLAVKPNIINAVLSEIQPLITTEKILISIAVGVTLKGLEKQLYSTNNKIARVMPNTPALVGEGMSVIAFGPNFTDDEKQMVEELFSSVGEVMVIDESLMDAAGAVSSSSPAFAFMFIEAMADAGVLGGLKRGDAYKLAAQSVLGSAKLYLDTKTHPAQLKDSVCSPAGTTIEGVKVLEEKGFRSAVIDAIGATIDKSKNISKM